MQPSNTNWAGYATEASWNFLGQENMVWCLVGCQRQRHTFIWKCHVSAGYDGTDGTRLLGIHASWVTQATPTDAPLLWIKSQYLLLPVSVDSIVTLAEFASEFFPWKLHEPNCKTSAFGIGSIPFPELTSLRLCPDLASVAFASASCAARVPRSWTRENVTRSHPIRGV